MPKILVYPAFFIALLLEGFLAIPLLGGTSVFLSGWSLLGYAFLIHLAAFILASYANINRTAPAIGIFTSVFGLIPVVGWVLHVFTFLTYLGTLLQSKDAISESWKDVSESTTSSTTKNNPSSSPNKKEEPKVTDAIIEKE